MPTIRIDDEVWQALKEQAEPFVDTPNDVLRRLLVNNSSHSDSAHQPKPSSDDIRISSPTPGRKQKLDRTQDSSFRVPILRSLVDLGGEATVAAILRHLRQYLTSELKSDDLKPLKSGEIRWENTAKWERKHLLDEGLLDPSRQGVWKISQLGRDYLKDEVAAVVR